MAFQSHHFINRELSWLAFNRRVLEEAQDKTNPLLERLKFFTIFGTNLDEFFEVRVAGLKQVMESGVQQRSDDGMTPSETFQALVEHIRRSVEEQYRCWQNELVPALARQRVRFLEVSHLSPQRQQFIDQYYRAEVRPVLTPLAIDSAHPFPQVLNRSLCLIVQVKTHTGGEQADRLSIVQVPRAVLPRLIQLPAEGQGRDYLLLEGLIGHYLNDLFTGMQIAGYWLFRVTRNSELYIDEEETVNLLQAVEKELSHRRRGAAVRLELQSGCPADIRTQLLSNLNLAEDDCYAIEGPLDPARLMMIYDGAATPELRDPPFVARVPKSLQETPDIFAAIREKDILMHHPYESFDAVVDFLECSAKDPQVLAIKQTLYRTGGDPRIIGALMQAVNNGKQVTAVVELRARFDEANNIEWARRLEEAGVHVVFGLVGYKIHGKVCLVVRKEDIGIRRYVHLSTGNYNPITARIYTDLGLLTCHPDFGEDATNLFNLLTGICEFPAMRKFLVAPYKLQARLLQMIRSEAEHARRGLPARIVAKMNSLVDREMIEALYEASQAGVRIDLIVRGVCCLRPQLKGISENITVRSIVDRFLEHSRIFYFENACQPKICIGSADWMPRNFHRRLEIVFPIDDGVLRERLQQEVLAICLADNVKARFLQPTGTYRRLRPKPAQAIVRSQLKFLELAANHKSKLKPAQSKQPKVRLVPRPKQLA